MAKAYAAPGKQWVYTAAGVAKYEAGRYATTKIIPGQLVHPSYRQSCPARWAESGWVEESDAAHD